jgi:pyruvate dehydrogenase E1 component alpha subunit
VKSYLVQHALWSDADEAALRADIDSRFRDCVAIAEKTPQPALETMFDDVYAKVPWHLAEQRAALVSGPRAPGAHG